MNKKIDYELIFKIILLIICLVIAIICAKLKMDFIDKLGLPWYYYFVK